MIGCFVGVPLHLEILAQREHNQLTPYAGLLDWTATGGDLVTLEPQADGSCIVTGLLPGHVLLSVYAKDPSTGETFVAQENLGILPRGHYVVPTPALRGLVIQQRRQGAES